MQDISTDNLLKNTVKKLSYFTLITLASLAASIGAAYKATDFSRGLLAGWALIIVMLGLLVFYYAARIYIDAKIFAKWQQLDIVKLDATLQKLNPSHIAGRSLESRIAGSLVLFKRGLSVFLVQLLLVIVWQITGFL